MIKKLGWCLNNFCVRWRNNLSLQYFKNSLFECLKLISLSLVFSIGLSYFSDHAYLEVNYFVFSYIFFWTTQKEIFILNWQPIEAFLLVTQAPTQFLNLNRIGLFELKSASIDKSQFIPENLLSDLSSFSGNIKTEF